MNILQGDLKEVWGKKKIKNLFQPVDNSSIVIFRLVFGAIMFWEVTRYFRYDWIHRYWVEPDFNFSYGPFNFQPLPEQYMYLLWYTLGTLAIFILIGFLYRISTVLFFVLFSYTFLLEQARYLNHFYLVMIISFILIFIPAHRHFSLDSILFRKIRSSLIPCWSLWLVRFTIAIPYFFGGVAKINPDWLRGYPLSNWLQSDMDFPLIGQFFDQRWMVMFMSYSGLLLDLLIVPVLLFKRTRLIGFIIISLFHLMNDQLFSIGIFPWFMMFATTIFFAPDWPRKLLSSVGLKPNPNTHFQDYSLSRPIVQKGIIVGLALFVALQVSLPFRHLLIPGNVHWTEEGHRYAWHMKLRGKSGITRFYIQDEDSEEKIQIRTDGFIEDWQANKMDGKPYMIWEFAQHIQKEFRLMGSNVKVYVDAWASLNGRSYQQLIAPNFDITQVPKPWFGNADWILPLNTPLENQR
ncbi:HTTM domain-containing protein [Roseivirga sp. E12]|uniref:HTTM domain-containing protein n=1 Tax=Roseivirga sp. E12 TaxID=2819237 RepID=UPI001ABC6FF5|nr:HTTM domain-containing protein [Roseivirga sp. E12]MBO3698630.1 HTTM domain-containing protein [Roseivirga sp. E12]